jgi:hypothetical protein
MATRTVKPAACRWRWVWVAPPARRRETRSLGVLEIAPAGGKADRYEVVFLGRQGQSTAVRLVKADGELYAVLLDGPHGNSCDCASWTMGRAHVTDPKLRDCKHVAASAAALKGLTAGTHEGDTNE